jgi:hypothetical protein
METWLSVFTSRASKWGISPGMEMDLAVALLTAKDVLAKAKSGERSPDSVAECNAAFKDLEAEARYIKKHYLQAPPLTLDALSALLLPFPGEAGAPCGKPAGPSLAIGHSGGPHRLEVHLRFPVGASLMDPAGDLGCVLYRGVMPPGGATLVQAASAGHYLLGPPSSGEEMLYFRFTRRRREPVVFAAREAGMVAYFCSRYENGNGEAGPWGPVVSAPIP